MKKRGAELAKTEHIYQRWKRKHMWTFRKWPISFLIFPLLLTGCINSVKYLPSNESVNYPPVSSVKVYWEKPDMPYTEIGLISAESYNKESALIFIKNKAKEVGADGIIMKPMTHHQGGWFFTTVYVLEAIAIKHNEK